MPPLHSTGLPPSLRRAALPESRVVTETDVEIGLDRRVARVDFHTMRSSPAGREELLLGLAQDLVTETRLKSLRRDNPRRGGDTIRADCLVALNTLIDSFDPSRHPSLFKHASCLLRFRVLELWRSEAKGQKTSTTLRKELAELGADATRLPTDELAAQLGLAPEELRHRLRKLLLESPKSLTPHTDDHHAGIHSVEPQDKDPSHEALVDQRLDLAAELQGLPRAEREVLAARLAGETPLAIAASRRVSESRIFRLQAAGIARLHKLSQRSLFDPSGFRRFVQALARPDARLDQIRISDFARTPDFFRRYLSATTGVFAFKRELSRRVAGGEPALGVAAPLLVRYLESTYGALDLIPAATQNSLAALLGVEHKVGAILRALKTTGATDLSIPSDDKEQSRMRKADSPLFDPVIVGSKRADRNVAAHIRNLLPSLDALASSPLLARIALLLGLPASLQKVAGFLVRTRILSARPSDEHVATIARHSRMRQLSLYLNSEVVGAAVARENLGRYLHQRYGNLDGITRNQALAALLGCRNTARELVRACSAAALLGTRPPFAHPISRRDGRLSVYYDSSLFGEAAERRFAERFLIEVPTLDHLQRNVAIARALRCKNAVPDLARRAMELGLLPATPPTGLPLFRPSGVPSRYFHAQIFGKAGATKNVVHALHRLVPDLDAISNLHDVAKLLGVHGTERAVARRCITLGIANGPASLETQIIRPDGTLSLHLDPRVRRRHLCLKDLKRLVEHQEISLDSLASKPALALLLRCEPSPSSLSQALVRCGIFSASPAPRLAVRGRLHPLVDPTVAPPDTARANLRRLLRDRFPTLDHVERDAALAKALRCDNTRIAIATKMIELGVYSWRMPRGASLFAVSGGSFYVKTSVMGDPRRVDLNIKRSIRGRITTLDDVRQNEALATALGCEKSATAIARTLALRNILSPVVPEGHPFAIGHTRSNYFDRTVVGPSQLQENLRRYFQHTAATLDDLPMSDALCAEFGIDRRRRALAAHAVKRGYLDPIMPAGHNVQRAGGTLYFDKIVVPPDALVRNIRQHVEDICGGNLDALPIKSKSISSALEVPNNKGAIIRALIDKKIVSPEPPAGYDPRKARASVYFHERFVGPTAANLRERYGYTLWQARTRH